MTREEAIRTLKEHKILFQHDFGWNTSTLEAIEMAIKALEQMPVLDKIRVEIEQTAKDYDKFADYRRVRGLWIALDIIDKYKGERW